MEELEIVKMLTLHTSHLTESTYNSLRLDSISGVVSYNKDDTNCCEQYGMFVYICQYWKEDNVPQDLADCIKLAEKNGCLWLMFDYDANVIEGLPVYLEEDDGKG